VEKGFLLVERQSAKDRIPLSSIEALILNSHGAYISNHVFSRLSEHNVPVVHCGSNAVPCALTLAYGANVYRKDRIEMQIKAGLPLKKKLWQQAVRAKIANQSAVLRLSGKHALDLETLAGKVLSGDAGNYEAAAARLYWERLMGPEFRRDPEREGRNSFLNYGYAILRAALCRNLVASGLIPELGIHHHNQMNPYCLADDLMEPFRPYVDLCLVLMKITDSSALDPVHKKKLVGILDLPLAHGGISTHLRHCVQRTVEQYVRSLGMNKACLDYPLIDESVKEGLLGQTGI
jgi:CRISPR-associated protein Cas1